MIELATYEFVLFMVVSFLMFPICVALWQELTSYTLIKKSRLQAIKRDAKRYQNNIPKQPTLPTDIFTDEDFIKPQRMS